MIVSRFHVNFHFHDRSFKDHTAEMPAGKVLDQANASTAKRCNPPLDSSVRVAMFSRFPGVFYHGWRWRVFQRNWSSRDSCLLIEQSEYYTEIAAGFLCKRTEPCSGTFLAISEVKDSRTIFFCFRFGIFFLQRLPPNYIIWVFP